MYFFTLSRASLALCSALTRAVKKPELLAAEDLKTLA